jgi:hypothetical protein
MQQFAVRKGFDEEGFIIAIGRITLQYSLLESLIQNCANILIGGEGAGIATAKLSMQNLLDTLSALYRQTNIISNIRKSIDKLDELLLIVTVATEQRNKIVHSLWYIRVNDPNKPLTRVKKNLKRKTGLSIDREQMDIEDLNKVIKIISNAVAYTQDFINDILSNFGVVLTSPADKTSCPQDVQIEFYWLKVEGAIGYELQIVDKSTLIATTSGIIFVTNNKYIFKEPLKKGTTYFWRVRPVIATAQGFWSEIRSIIVQ